MSSISIIAIKGNHLDRVSEIFAAFRYVDLNNDKQFEAWDKSAAYLYDNYFDFAARDIALRGLWIDNDWTIFCDPEMIDAMNDDAIFTISEKLNAEVLTFLIQTNSGSFGFAKYNRTKQRHFFSTNGQVVENFGALLTQENELNINDKMFIDDIINLAGKFGIDLEAKKVKTTFTVKELGYND